MLIDEQKVFLLKLARESILSWLENRDVNLKKPGDPIYETHKGGFVTIHKQGKLRGCIGYIEAYRTVYETIKEMARSAAFRDPRFPILMRKEFAEIDLEISLLSELIPVKETAEIVVGRDGLVIRNPVSTGILLPQVATEWHWDRDTFIRQVCLKAGLGVDAWKEPETELYRFQAEIFSEAEKSV